MSCQFKIEKDCTVTASFKQGGQLNVTKIGSGIVTSSPSGIGCSCDCKQFYFLEGAPTVVRLTAEPAISATFVGWGGDCSGTGDCVLTMTMDQVRNVTALFTQGGQYLLTVNKVGSGRVTSSPPGINCGDDCIEAYNEGTQVTLTIIADSGWRITGFNYSGFCNEINIGLQFCALEVLRSIPTMTLSCPFNMVEPNTITVNFEPE